MTSPNGHYSPGQDLAELGAMLGEVGVDPRKAAVVVAYTQEVIASATAATLRFALNAIREGHEARRRELTKMVEQMPRMGRYSAADRDAMLRLAELRAAPGFAISFDGALQADRRPTSWPAPVEPSHPHEDGR